MTRRVDAGLFIRDRDRGVTELIAPDSLYGDPGVSGDGRFVSYLAANGAVQVLDRRDGMTEEVTPSAANGAALSESGRWVAFSSTAALVADDTNATADLYLFDRLLRRFERVSVPQAGGEADGPTYGWATQISATGRYVLFRSSATNLVNNDTNGFVDDVFLRDRWKGTTELISANVSGGSGNDYSWPKDISADGRIVVFHSLATDVVPGSAGGFFRDRWTGRTFAIKGFSPDSVDATGLIAAGRDSTGGIAILNRLTGAITRVSVPRKWRTRLIVLVQRHHQRQRRIRNVLLGRQQPRTQRLQQAR